MRYMQIIEVRRVNAITPKIVSEHIVRVEAVVYRYGIKSASHSINLDELGASFDSIARRSLRRGVTNFSSSVAVTSFPYAHAETSTT